APSVAVRSARFDRRYGWTAGCPTCGVSKIDHPVDPRVCKERAAARAVNSETPAAYEVLHQPRETTVRPLMGQQETAGQGRDRVLIPHRLPADRRRAAPPRRSRL